MIICQKEKWHKYGIVLVVSVIIVWFQPSVNAETPIAIPGFDNDLVKDILYYTSFSSPEPEVNKGEIKNSNLKDFQAGFYGNAALLNSKGLVLESTLLGFNNNRTCSFWFRFDEKLAKNQFGKLFANYGRAYKKNNFVSVFFKGGPWCALKDSALVAQIQNFNKIENQHKIPDRNFRQNYPVEKWHHFAITAKSGKVFTIYLDGQVVQTLKIDSHRPLAATDNLTHYAILSGWSIPVFVDELLVLGEALTTEQIKAYYNANQVMYEREQVLKSIRN